MNEVSELIEPAPTAVHRLPWSPPERTVTRLDADHVVAFSPGDPWGHAVAICMERAAPQLMLSRSRFDVEARRFVDGPLAGDSISDLDGGSSPTRLPVLVEAESRAVVCDDPMLLCRAIAPDLFSERGEMQRAVSLRRSLLDSVYRLGSIADQADYEAAHAKLVATVQALDRGLTGQRFLGDGRANFGDVLLFTFSVRLDSVYYELFKATVGRLRDFPALQAHAQDLYERPAFASTTDFDAIKTDHYLVEPVLNPKQIIPRGGLPDLDAPHFRGWEFEPTAAVDNAIEEDQNQARVSGEWVRGRSHHRDWIRPHDDAEYPAAAGRYHLYAPYNCPWSHRALLAREVKGLGSVVGASIVYFRRDPEHGWQFNPAIPGCTADPYSGANYVTELYESVGSEERSVPVLWDVKTETIVSNESAEILRMFNEAFGSLAERAIDLYPARYRDEIDRLNEAVYQRINNGAYKAGFARSQQAYDRAFARYFRALDWLEELLGTRTWLADSERPTEADLRLFPTLFRHDAVYYARFKLNRAKLADYPGLSDWLSRMLEVPGVEVASNLDHARNGYFGRTGNEIVPAGPVPLGLSPSDFSRDVWLNRR